MGLLKAGRSSRTRLAPACRRIIADSPCAVKSIITEPRQIIYRANILIAETQEKAQQALAQYPREAVFRLKDRIAATLLEVDQRNVAGEGRRPANVNRALPINFCGGPDEIVAQLKEAANGSAAASWICRSRPLARKIPTS
jgi:hypothetical protein